METTITSKLVAYQRQYKTLENMLNSKKSNSLDRLIKALLDDIAILLKQNTVATNEINKKNCEIIKKDNDIMSLNITIEIMQKEIAFLKEKLWRTEELERELEYTQSQLRLSELPYLVEYEN